MLKAAGNVSNRRLLSVHELNSLADCGAFLRTIVLPFLKKLRQPMVRKRTLHAVLRDRAKAAATSEREREPRVAAKRHDDVCRETRE